MDRRWIYILSGIFAIGLLVVLYFIIEKEREEGINTPLIDYNNAINVDVKTISFERNGLFINNEAYDAGGISAYSRIKGNSGVEQLNEIKPPFLLKKKEFNDTLVILKNKEIFYLLVNEEKAWANRKFD